MSPSEWRAEVFDPAELDAADLYDDASAKTALYARLSRNAASSGDVVIAVAATWAADVHAVQALWWERARDAGGGPFEPFLAAGAAIATAAGSPARTSRGPDEVVPPADVAGRDDPPTARAVIEVARRGLLAAFDPSAAMLVAGRLAAVDHLSGLPAPSAPAGRPPSAVPLFAARVDGGSVDRLVDELWTVALDARVVAGALKTAGYPRDALEQLVLAETANFEAYLLRVAEAVGDTDLLGADLRRAALADLLPPLHELPPELGPARLAVRDVMRTVLGTGELGRFARLLEAYDAAEVVVELPEHVLWPAVVLPDLVTEVVPFDEPAAAAVAAPAPAAVGAPAGTPVVHPVVPVVPAQAMRVPAPAAADQPVPTRVAVLARNTDRVRPLVAVPDVAAGQAKPQRVSMSDVQSGPLLDLPPVQPSRHRDIFAQDLGGLGPRVGTLAPRRDP